MSPPIRAEGSCFNCNEPNHQSRSCPNNPIRQRCCYCFHANNHYTDCPTHTFAVLPLRTYMVSLSTLPREARAEFSFVFDEVERMSLRDDRAEYQIGSNAIDLAVGSCRLVRNENRLAFFGRPTAIIGIRIFVDGFNKGLQIHWAADAVLVGYQYHVIPGQLTVFNTTRKIDANANFAISVGTKKVPRCRLQYGENIMDRYYIRELDGHISVHSASMATACWSTKKFRPSINDAQTQTDPPINVEQSHVDEERLREMDNNKGQSTEMILGNDPNFVPLEVPRNAVVVEERRDSDAHSIISISSEEVEIESNMEKIDSEINNNVVKDDSAIEPLRKPE